MQVNNISNNVSKPITRETKVNVVITDFKSNSLYMNAANEPGRYAANEFKPDPR